MADNAVQGSRDWLSSPPTSLVAWWLPQTAILATLFVIITLGLGSRLLWVKSRSRRSSLNRPLFD